VGIGLSDTILRVSVLQLQLWSPVTVSPIHLPPSLGERKSSFPEANLEREAFVFSLSIEPQRG
jgi:hypothetical protein